MKKEFEQLSFHSDELMPLICEVIGNGGSFELVVTGSSMAPTLTDMHDKVSLVSAETRPPKRNDILLYRRDNGQYVLHRMLRRRGNVCTVNGDAQTQTEKITDAQIIAVVQSVCVKDKWYSVDSVGNRLYVFFWRLTRPIRPLIFKFLRVTRPFRKRKSRRGDCN